jgi:L-seryl-tRNA(Ser) seleniumtransferase
VETLDAIGGGAFPTDALAGFGVGIRFGGRSAESLAVALRTAAVPVIPGIRDGQVILHVRTLLEGDETSIASSFSEALGSGAG